jgi:hypothetical protein
MNYAYALRRQQRRLSHSTAWGNIERDIKLKSNLTLLSQSCR